MIIMSACLLIYLLGFGILLVVMTAYGPLPPWLNSVANWVYAPVIALINHIFGGIC